MIMLVFALEPLLKVGTLWSCCDLDSDFMAMNGHETVGFESDDSANAVEGLVLRENIFPRVFAPLTSLFTSLPVILVQEMNGVPLS